MGRKEKLIDKLYTSPRAVTFDDVESLLSCCSYCLSTEGKTSGSRVIFISEEYPPILLHKPHPQKELKEYQAKQLIQILEQEGLI